MTAAHTLPRRRGAASVVSALALAAGLALAAPAAPVMAFGAPESFAELAEKISPSVVNITTSSLIAGPATGGPRAPEGSPFEDFFNQFQDPNGAPQRSEALGSGFVISDNGEIATNAHVVTTGEGAAIRKAARVFVRFGDRNQVPATRQQFLQCGAGVVMIVDQQNLQSMLRRVDDRF